MIRDLQLYAQGYMFIEKMCCEFDSEIWDAKMFQKNNLLLLSNTCVKKILSEEMVV